MTLLPQPPMWWDYRHATNHTWPLWVGSQTSFDLDVSDSFGKHRVKYAPRTTFSWSFRCQDESSFYDVTLMIRLGLQAWQKNVTEVRLLFHHTFQRVHAVSTICCQCPRFLPVKSPSLLLPSCTVWKKGSIQGPYLRGGRLCSPLSRLFLGSQGAEWWC